MNFAQKAFLVGKVRCYKEIVSTHTLLQMFRPERPRRGMSSEIARPVINKSTDQSISATSLTIVGIASTNLEDILHPEDFSLDEDSLKKLARESLVVYEYTWELHMMLC